MKKHLYALSLASVMLATVCPVSAKEEKVELSPYGAYTSEGFSKRYWSEENQKALAEKIERINTKAAPLTTRSGNVILNTPQYIQENAYYCVPASVSVVIKYVTGHLYSQTDLANAMGTVIGVGTEFENALPQLRGITGLDYELANSNQYDFYSNMVNDINGNCPIIYFVNQAYLYDDGQNVGHAIVGNGYGSNNIAWFWDVDGTHSTTNWSISASDMNAAMNGVASLGPDFIGGCYIF